MPDQATAPGSAPQGAGSAEPQTPPEGTTAEGGAQQGGESGPRRESALLDKLLAGVNDANKKQWDNMRSTHDRQMGQLRQEMRERTRAKPAPSAGEYDDDVPGAGTTTEETRQTPVAQLEPEEAEQMALNTFENRHRDEDDFREYYASVQQIADSDELARPFRMLRVDGNGDLQVDVTRSLELIRLHVLNERKDARILELEKSQGASTKDRLRRDATISGQPNTTGEAPDTKSMNKKQKLEWLHANHPEMFDPNDLPKELRGKR